MFLFDFCDRFSFLVSLTIIFYLSLGFGFNQIQDCKSVNVNELVALVVVLLVGLRSFLCSIRIGLVVEVPRVLNFLRLTPRLGLEIFFLSTDCNFQ